MQLQYLPIAEAQTDDVVQYFKPNNRSTGFINESLYITREPYISDGYHTHHAGPGTIRVKFDTNRSQNGWAEGYFKLVKTKTGNHAKVGDLCILIKDHPNSTLGPKCNTVFRATGIRNNVVISDIPTPFGSPTWEIPQHLFKVLVTPQHITKPKPL